jgi:hypothetical protein
MKPQPESIMKSKKFPLRPVRSAVMDREGELYLLANANGMLTGTTGVVMKIVRPRP